MVSQHEIRCNILTGGKGVGGGRELSRGKTWNGKGQFKGTKEPSDSIGYL